jgi:protease-4
MANNGSKIGCWIAIAILVLMLFGSFLANIGLTAAVLAGSSMGHSDRPLDAEPDFAEIWSQGYGDTKVVRIGLSGVIMRGRRERLLGSGPDMVESILSQILAARQDPEVRAILLEVDSPGGAVTPSDEIYAALQQFKESRDDRVILVFIRDLGASGAYYAAMAGDYIMAEPTAIVGSVGVIMQTLNMKGLGDMIGLKSVTIASGANKDMLNPLKEVDPQHVELLQNLVDEMQDRFAGIVMDSRGIESRALLDGRVFTAQQALTNNLIDGIGYWLEAVDQLKVLLGVDDVYIIRYGEEHGFLNALLAARSPKLPDINAMESPRFLYLWKP